MTSSKHCDSPRKRGQPPCQKPAGWGTRHPGVGRCRLHGGLQESDNRFRHGLYSPVLKKYLAGKFDEWNRAAARATDLLEELEALRALATHTSDDEELDVDQFLHLVDRIIKSVAVQQRFEKQGLVSLETVSRYLETIGIIIARHVKDRTALQAIEADLRKAPILMGGGTLASALEELDDEPPTTP